MRDDDADDSPDVPDEDAVSEWEMSEGGGFDDDELTGGPLPPRARSVSAILVLLLILASFLAVTFAAVFQ